MSFPLATKRGRAPSSSMVVLMRGVLLLCLSLLMSCGGGGGGGGEDGGGGNGTLHITLHTTSVSWTYLEGSAPGVETITASASGDYDGPLFVGAIVENDGTVNAIDPNITIAIDGTEATAFVTPVAGLTEGTYTGRILFLACSDAACNNRIGGTPLTVTFTVTVQLGLRVTPTAITLSAESGNTAAEDVTVMPGTNETGFTVGATAAFVQIANQTASGFSVTVPSLPAGEYGATIPLEGSLGSRLTIPLTYTVTPPAGGEQGISISPNSVTLTTTEGATSSAQEVQVTEPTWRPGLQAPVIEYIEGQDWLDVVPAADGYSFVADAANLPSGTYTARVIFRSNPLPDGINAPALTSGDVAVSLTVGPGLIRPADILTTIDSETLPAALSDEVEIDLAGGPAATWNAVSDVSWLTVTPSGATGSALSYSIDPTWLSTAANFAEHVATINVSVPGTVITPIQFSVRVQRSLAEISGVGARVQAAGQPTTLVVGGRGFSALANPGARFSATNASPTSVQRVSDTKLLVSFDSLDPGEHVVRLSNALDFSTATRSVIAVTPTPYAYSSVASGGSVTSLAIDHETDTLYGVHFGIGAALDQGTLVRFRPGGGNWSVDAPSIAAVDNVGVLLDGSVIVSTRPGTLVILDRDTLNATFSIDLQCTGVPIRRGSMPVTLDGRVWLSQQQSSSCSSTSLPEFNRLGWFDPSTHVFQLFEPPHEQWFVQLFRFGPSFIMSRDGERLIMHQDSNQSFPPWIYLDATESVLRPVPPPSNLDEYEFETASASDDGSRILLDARFVKNEQFETIGAVSIPPYSLPFADTALPSAAVLSPDGARAYVLTYPSSFLAQPTTPALPLPRVWVLDTSGDVGGGVTALGYFEIADYPTCLRGADAGCDYRARAAISLDGHTLFLVGDERFVVTPIPAEGTLTDANTGSGRAQQMKTRPWLLPKH